MTNIVSFPGLGLEFTLNRIAFTLFGRPIYWYGIIIASGLLLAVYLCGVWGKRFGITEDNVLDLMLVAVPVALISVRVYYVVFNLELYRKSDGSLDWGAMVRYSDGGLAIYGAIISSVIVLFLFCHKKNINFLAFGDLGVHGLLIGQLIGRWGNFMNVEAFGTLTTLPWRMCSDSIARYLLQHDVIDESVTQSILDGTVGVHPTFLYESLWNLVGLGLIYWIGTRRKFDGQCFFTYFLWYGIGRTWIEGLRTDSLYFFGLELFGVPIRTSQMVAAVTAGIAGIILLYALCKGGQNRPLYVNRRTAEIEKQKEE